MDQQPLIVERTYSAPVSRVWKAITSKDEMRGWYFSLAEFRAEVGFKFEFTAGEDGKAYKHLCRITEVAPYHKLSYTWRYDGRPGDSEVRFELSPEGDKTRLKLTHVGLETFASDDNPDFKVSSFTQGWNHILGISLKEYMEREESASKE